MSNKNDEIVKNEEEVKKTAVEETAVSSNENVEEPKIEEAKTEEPKAEEDAKEEETKKSKANTSKIKLKVLVPFTDKYTDEKYKLNDVITVDKERATELLNDKRKLVSK